MHRQRKRSPKQTLSPLAFTCISSGTSLTPIKRWFSLDLQPDVVSQRSRRSQRSCRGEGEYWPLYQRYDRFLLSASDGDSLLKCNDCGMLNACETMIVFISLYGDGLNPVCSSITRVEGKPLLVLLMHLRCLKKKSVLLFFFVSLNQFS